MNQIPHNFYSFLCTVQGNWRNAIFIQCSCQFCSQGNAQPCLGFLFSVDSEGHPFLIPVEKIYHLTGENVEYTDCCGVLDKQSFESAYHQYLVWHVDSSPECALWKLCEQSCCDDTF